MWPGDKAIVEEHIHVAAIMLRSKNLSPLLVTRITNVSRSGDVVHVHGN